MQFIQGIKAEVKGLLTANSGGALYLSRASAEALAELTPVVPVEFGLTPYMAFFGGAVVAADIVITALDGQEPVIQRTYLPVMDEGNNPIPAEKLTARAVNDAMQRCIVKALAMTVGVGAAPYLGFSETKEMLVKLGLKPDSDLKSVPAYSEKNDQAIGYVPWMAALIAARLTDPQFSWSVALNDRGVPAFQVGSGWSVKVVATYRGKTRSEWLPIMGGANHDDIVKPTVFDWNTAVMRALTKAIAYLTGYGLDVYVGEDLQKIAAQNPASQSQAPLAKSDTNSKNEPKPEEKPKPQGAPQAEPKSAQQPEQKPEAQPAPAAEVKAEVKAQPKTEGEISENLRQNLARVKTVTDIARLQGALARANELFGPAEGPIFKAAVEARIAELEASMAS
jgi:hypothetical protein